MYILYLPRYGVHVFLQKKYKFSNSLPLRALWLIWLIVLAYQLMLSELINVANLMLESTKFCRSEHGLFCFPPVLIGIRQFQPALKATLCPV